MVRHLHAKHGEAKEKKIKEESLPLGINLLKSQLVHGLSKFLYFQPTMTMYCVLYENLLKDKSARIQAQFLSSRCFSHIIRLIFNESRHDSSIIKKDRYKIPEEFRSGKITQKLCAEENPSHRSRRDGCN